MKKSARERRVLYKKDNIRKLKEDNSALTRDLIQTKEVLAISQDEVRRLALEIKKLKDEKGEMYSNLQNMNSEMTKLKEEMKNMPALGIPKYYDDSVKKVLGPSKLRKGKKKKRRKIRGGKSFLYHNTPVGADMEIHDQFVKEFPLISNEMSGSFRGESDNDEGGEGKSVVFKKEKSKGKVSSGEIVIKESEIELES